MAEGAGEELGNGLGVAKAYLQAALSRHSASRDVIELLHAEVDGGDVGLDRRPLVEFRFWSWAASSKGAAAGGKSLATTPHQTGPTRPQTRCAVKPRSPPWRPWRRLFASTGPDQIERIRQRPTIEADIASVHLAVEQLNDIA